MRNALQAELRWLRAHCIMPPREADEWQHFKKIGKASNGAWQVQCNFCLKQFQANSATRLRAHISCDADLCKQHTAVIRKLVVPEQFQLAVQQLGMYQRKEGKFADKALWPLSMPAHEWWDNFAPDPIRMVGRKVLAQTSASSACEQAWASMDFIHSKRRNKLTAALASDLVWVHLNMRLVERSWEQPMFEQLAEAGAAEADAEDGSEQDEEAEEPVQFDEDFDV